MEVTPTKVTPIAWVVNAADKAKFDELFQTLDTDLDGYINGVDPGVKTIFLQTALPQPILAHIWSLCDLKQNGKLNSEQFALAMYLISQVKLGNEIPATLLPEMVPPTLRPKPTTGSNVAIDNLLNSPQSQSNGVNKITSASFPTSTGNKELDLLAEEIKELQNEKNKLEQEANQQDGILKLKNSEIKNLQNESETLQQMIKQLEAQKVEARKRLDDMATQVDNLRKQVEEQKEKIESQENDINIKQKELDKLKNEENDLKSKLDKNKNNLTTISSNLANSQLQISQYKTKIMHFEEYEKQLNDGDLTLTLSNSDNIMKINDALNRLNITPPTIGYEPIDDFNKTTAFNDSFDDKDNTFPSLNEFAADPFAEADPFGQDIFSQFESNLVNKTRNISLNDPFQFFSGNDEFTTFKKDEPDPFGADPFANFKAESPTPELPPKKSKAPPPRPIPPKNSNKPGPPRPAPPPVGETLNDPFKSSDPWGSSTAAATTNDPFAAAGAAQASNDGFGTDFADFSQFDKV